MKTILIAVLILIAGGAYFAWSQQNQGTPVTSTTSVPSETLNPGTNPGTTTPAGGSTPPVAAGAYKNGTYTGAVSNSIYGPVQVAVTIAGGKIVTVNVPVFPNERGHTLEVSNESIPVLKQEVIAAQKAPVDSISGATQTVEAFNESLASALAKAV